MAKRRATTKKTDPTLARKATLEIIREMRVFGGLKDAGVPTGEARFIVESLRLGAIRLSDLDDLIAVTDVMRREW